MDATVAAGWIGGLAGLGGAIVGAGGAIVAGWIQQAKQAEVARAERLESRGYTAAQRALSELLAAREVLAAYTREPGSAPNPYRPARDAVRRAEAEVLVIPNGRELRHRMREIFSVYRADRWPESSTRNDRTKWRTRVIVEGITVLSCYLRGDALPGPSDGYVRTTSLMVPEEPA
ncbi:hypothetical protein [Actinacidiphila acidipaludis]|uniref:Uncharacterized protein n=1 Tax=Actinacidiphila acidipaludis TaxID=2873382 RepID=A0ABS7Q0L2_9ACTN|nr:hypothetical protein [Streptomyces acidipaludis]MBY8876667.1 hypothetical protein [Streptomyces acidipaludis]